MKPMLYLVTHSFPYSDGESFLDAELKYWSSQAVFDITILPTDVRGERFWRCPTNIKVDCSLALKGFDRKVERLFSSLRALFSPDLYESLRRESKISVRTFFVSLGVLVRTKEYQIDLERYFRKQACLSKAVFYTYWNNEYFYALAELKKQYQYCLVSRMHGYDIYRREKNNYSMPLKYKYADSINKLFVLSDNARKYANREYGYSLDSIKISRLGVPEQKILSLPEVSDILNIVSCSNVVWVKQVKRIVDALYIASKNCAFNFNWTHIGDGPDFKSLEIYANTKLKGIENVNYAFLGRLNSSSVTDYYISNKVDVFVNVSKSEGQPVSIMEALSFGVPIIAPDIGGISEMFVDDVSGILLSCDFNDLQLVNALIKKDFFKAESSRKAALECYRDKFNAVCNYQKFIRHVELEYDKHIDLL